MTEIEEELKDRYDGPGRRLAPIPSNQMQSTPRNKLATFLVPTLGVGTRALDALRPVGRKARYKQEATRSALESVPTPERGNKPAADRHPFGLRPTARARISTVRHSNPDPVYPRAAREISPGLVGPPPAHRESIDFLPPSALRPPPFFAVHQWINVLHRPNPPTFSKLFQRPRPSQAGQARSASRSAVTISDLDPASDPGRRASLEGYPGKRRTISVRRSLFPEVLDVPALRKTDSPGHAGAAGNSDHWFRESWEKHCRIRNIR